MSMLLLQFCTHLLTFLHQEVEFLQRLDLVPPCLQLLILPPRDGDVRTRAEGLLKIIRGFLDPTGSLAFTLLVGRLVGHNFVKL